MEALKEILITFSFLLKKNIYDCELIIFKNVSGLKSVFCLHLCRMSNICLAVLLFTHIHITDDYLSKMSLCEYFVKAAIFNPTISILRYLIIDIGQ